LPKRSSNKSLRILKFPCKSGNTSLKSRGIFFLLFVIFIGAIAVNSGNNLVYLTFSTILSFILISGFLSFSNLRNISAEIKLQEFVFAKKQSAGYLLIKNNSPSPKFRLKTELFGYTFQVDLLSDIFALRFSKIFERRGIYKIPGIKITSDFPFGFFERKKKIELNESITVFPEIKSVSINRLEGNNESIAKRRKGYGEEFHSVRKYIEGEDSRRINWKLTAKANEPMVIETSGEKEKLDVFMDTSSYLYKNEDEFEDAVVKITSLVYKCFLCQTKLSFRINNDKIRASSDKEHYRKIFEILATVKMTDTTPLPVPRGAITYGDITYD